MLPINDKRCEHCGAVLRKVFRPLTRKQAAVYAYVRDFITVNGYAPSFDEIAAHFGYKSLATVHEHLIGIERKGWIRRDYNESRAITIMADAA